MLPESNRYCKVTGTKRVLTSCVRENSSLYCWKICAGWCSNWLDLNGLDVTPWAWQGPYYRHGHHMEWHCPSTKLWPRTVTGKKKEEEWGWTGKTGVANIVHWEDFHTGHGWKSCIWGDGTFNNTEKGYYVLVGSAITIVIYNNIIIIIISRQNLTT